MANPLPKKRCAHATFWKPDEPDPKKRGCMLNAPDVMDPKTGKPKEKFCTCGNNPLAMKDFIRMNLPRALWSATMEGVTPSVKPAAEKYASQIIEARRKGAGAYIYGPMGVGKSGLAAALSKEASAWGFTVYCSSVSELREAVRAKRSFDPQMSVFDRCRSVDFLFLDDLQLQDATEHFFSLAEIRNMIVNRRDGLLVTLVTSRVYPNEWSKDPNKWFFNELGRSLATLEVKGECRSQPTNLFK